MRSIPRRHAITEAHAESQLAAQQVRIIRVLVGNRSGVFVDDINVTTVVPVKARRAQREAIRYRTADGTLRSCLFEGGEVNIRGVPGRGTTVSVSIPMSRQHR